MKNIVLLFGGISSEHEVSIITGLQVLENIDRNQYVVYPIQLSKNGLFEFYEGLTKKRNYFEVKPKSVNFGRDQKGAFFQEAGLLSRKNYIDAAYLAFHGGAGESGQIQGFLEVLGVPYTSPNVEASSTSMNKVLTKEVLSQNQIGTIPYTSLLSIEIIENVDACVARTLSKVGLPLIIKPAHLGSSIGIGIAKTKIELKKCLLEAAHIDTEILVEELKKDFQEYNISVRKIDGKLQTSEVEKPISKDEILSFADKYKKGGKKLGGMASLNRELPAKISSKLRNKLLEVATESFKAIRAKGMVRIDFLVCGSNIYVSEINPIPGSMSFYLWEASGISFKDQITDLINQALKDFEESSSKKLDYKSDIIKKFINSKDR